jgi:uncharacterized membrane protein
MKLMICIGLALLFLTSSLVLNAQSIGQSSSPMSSGKLLGLILDPSEARVVGAKIIVEAKGFRREVISSDDGSYEIALPEGKYKVRVELGGFYPSRKKTVRISSNATTKLDVTLKGIRNDAEHP